MDTRRGCRSKRSPAPWKNKNICFRCMEDLFAPFFLGEGFILRLSSYGGLFHRMEAFLLLFLYVGGLFATFSSWCGAFFTMWGPFLQFLSSCGILCLYVFFMGLPLPPMTFLCFLCMLLCNFHPMSSAITYSGHCIPNKAHCNTRVQFTMTMK